MIPQWQQDIINSKIQNYVYSVEWLNKKEEVIKEVILDVISGNVNFDATNNSRISCNLTLKNLDKKYIPNSNGLMQMSNRFRLKAGYEYGNGESLLFNQGILCLGNPSLLSSPTQKEAIIQGLDKWNLINGTLGGTLQSKYIIPINTRIDTVIKNIVTDLMNEPKYIIDSCSTLTPYTIEKESNTKISDIIIELCDMVSYQAFYDNNGYFRFRKALKPEDYNSTPVAWYYTTSGIYLQGKRDVNWTDVRNSIAVYGETLPDGTVVYALAESLTGSDFSIDEIGLKPDIITDTNIYDNPLAQERADYELQQKIMVAETIDSDVVPNFSHVLEDIINITDENNGANGNYVLQNISYNLSHDTSMSLGMWAIRNWS